jgi:hypothetical protein
MGAIPNNLRAMLHDEIAREGSMSSFMIRSGLLVEILARVTALETALEAIAEETKRQQLPITAAVHEIARAALAKALPTDLAQEPSV